ncbi:MAG: U32 family peptidase [Oscillospiraceae bacterium]|nr:U32 family peptidase [Oscillospiraceae bacterium]
MLEILSPAGSPESVVAAVQNGADAVYMGFGDFNARKNAKNFSQEDLAKAVEYCRVRGVKTYITLNTLVSDREVDKAVKYARAAYRLGADGLIIQDWGLMQAVRQAVPEMRITASTQMTVHNLEGVKMAAAMGADRVVLARELSSVELRDICRQSPIEIEIFGHGALCMCYSGQCEMSAVIGRRSGNRGACAQPCRLPYAAVRSNNKYPLSLKDNCLAGHLREIEDMGVASLKIEGRMRRPEYTAIVTGIYSKAVKEGKNPSEEDMRVLAMAFSRQGFTDGYFTGKLGRDMFGVKDGDEKQAQVIFATARKNYLNGEFQRVPVWFVSKVAKNQTAKLVARDDRGNSAAAEGLVPEMAFHKSITPVTMQTQLMKTGGTPFYCQGVKSYIDPGLALPTSAINEMRRSVLSEIMDKRRSFEPRKEGEYRPAEQYDNRQDAPGVTVSVKKLSQLTPEMAQYPLEAVYVPIEELRADGSSLRPFFDRGIEVCATVPRIIHDNERRIVRDHLEYARLLGMNTALVGNIGHIQFARGLGFEVRGDFGLNIFNSLSLDVMRELKLLSATLSFELRFEQIRDISKCIDTEIIAYGRLPLMITENCVIKNDLGTCGCDNFPGLTDRMGALFPVMKEFGCRNGIYNSQKLFLADKADRTDRLGLWAKRLCFTTENPPECLRVLKSYMEKPEYIPASYTRGLYFRGVE